MHAGAPCIGPKQQRIERKRGPAALEKPINHRFLATGTEIDRTPRLRNETMRSQHNGLLRISLAAVIAAASANASI